MLKLTNVTKKYGSEVILEHADYSFPETGLVCLLGASGSGKTTLLNLIAGFDSDYEGEICFCGKVLSELERDNLCTYRRDCIGFVFQNYHLLLGHSVLENILTAAELTGDSMEESRHRAQVLLDHLGIAEKAGQSVETLSGGQKQRVAIARALMGNPKLILADEPTGALDRKTSNEIMGLLKELAKERLVLVITHDGKVCEFADEVIHIEEKKIVAERTAAENAGISAEETVAGNAGVHSEETVGGIFDGNSHSKGKTPHGEKTLPRGRAHRNFRVHLKRYLAVAAAFSIGMLAFLFALSFGNVIDAEIIAFQEKNTVFNNGYIKGTDDGTILKLLQEEPRIENAYYQYVLKGITLTMGEQEVKLEEKLPLPKTTESLSYGVMPRREEEEIALSPSLAKKFAQDIQTLLGQTMTLTTGDSEYSLTISGIYNAGYDDFFVSSDIEQKLYADLPQQENYSISYDTAGFENVVAVSNFLELRGIHAKNAAAEVYNMQQSFRSIEKLFRVISVLILFLALFLCAVLLVKLQNSRFRELGLLSALGFKPAYIKGMIRWENLYLAAFSSVVTGGLLAVADLVSRIAGFPLKVGIAQFFICLGGAFVVVIVVSTLASIKLIHTEPAEALRHE